MPALPSYCPALKPQTALNMVDYVADSFFADSSLTPLLIHLFINWMFLKKHSYLKFPLKFCLFTSSLFSLPCSQTQNCPQKGEIVLSNRNTRVKNRHISCFFYIFMIWLDCVLGVHNRLIEILFVCRPFVRQHTLFMGSK